MYAVPQGGGKIKVLKEGKKNKAEEGTQSVELCEEPLASSLHTIS